MPYGTIACDTLTASTGVLATQNGMTGIAKAWANFNGTAGTVTNSFNISSITRNSTGSYTLSFTTAMPNINYLVNATGGSANRVMTSDNSSIANTTSAFTLRQTDLSGTVQDYTIMYCSVFSS
jgi:hypothetical protein